jgi:O-antigen/teichoic acid export membrane protein
LLCLKNQLPNKIKIGLLSNNPELMSQNLSIHSWIKNSFTNLMYYNKTGKLLSTSRQLLSDVGKMGFFHLLSANFFIQLLTFSSGLFVAWILTPEQIGQIKVMQSYSGVAIIIAGLGFNISVLKLCSENRTPGQKLFLYNKAFNYTLITVISSYIIFSIIALMGLASADATINNLQISYLQALKKIKEFAKIQSSTRILAVFFIIGLTYFFGINGFIISSIISGIITFVFMQHKTRQITKNIHIEPIETPFKTHWIYAKFSFLANTFNTVGLYLDMFLLNFFIADRTELGYYGFAVTLIMGLRLVTATVQQITYPYFSEKSGNIVELKRIFKKYNTLFIALSIVMAIAAFFSVEPILEIMFAGKYAPSTKYLQLLIVAWFIRNTYVFYATTIWGLGKLNVNFYNTLIVLPINALLMFLSIQKFDVIGAAYGNIANAIITFIVIFISFKLVMRKVKENSKKLIL